MQLADIAPKDRLIVSLDLPAMEPAEAMIARLGDSVSFYKIGYQLVYAGGLPLAQKLRAAGKKVFIDVKLHDIGNTVKSGVVTGKVPADAGTIFLPARFPAMASIGIIIMKRPKNIAVPSE